jgi:hypothetical protein
MRRLFGRALCALGLHAWERSVDPSGWFVYELCKVCGREQWWS